MIIWENLCTRSDMNATFCGVFDGHGPYGHMVSRKVRDALPLLLRAEWEAKLNIHQNSGHENGDAERESHFDNSVDDDRGAELNGHQNSVHKKGDAKGMSYFSNFVDDDGGAKVNSHCISVHENGDAEGMSHFDNSLNDDGGDSVEVKEKDKFPEMHMPLKKSILKAFKLMDKELKLHDTINSFCSGTTDVTLIMQGQDLIIGNIGDSRAVLETRDDGNALIVVQLTVDLKPNLPMASAPDSGTATRALVNCATIAWRFKYHTSKNDDCAAICLFLKHVSFEVLEAQNGLTKAHEEDMKKILVPTPGGMEISNEALTDIIVHSCTTTNKSSVILPVTDVAKAQNDVTNADNEEMKKVPFYREEDMAISDETRATVVVHSVITKESSEIVPVVEEMEDKLPGRSLSQFKRSLAEYLSTADDEWSTLEGIARVNSLLSLPRLSSESYSRVEHIPLFESSCLSTFKLKTMCA